MTGEPGLANDEHPRRLFAGYYAKTDEEIKSLWEEAVFVFDTNTLLHLHRYSEEAREDWLRLLEHDVLGKRVWIPRRVAEEYHANLANVCFDQAHAFTDLKATSERATATFGELRKKRRFHPSPRWWALLDQAQAALREITHLADAEWRQSDRSGRPDVLERAAKILSGRIGKKWAEDVLKARRKEAEERLARKQPPGFGKDEGKGIGRDRRLGDVFVWMQMVEYAIEAKKPLIFVTEDTKGDWWLEQSGETKGPHPELVQEMWESACVPFYMYNAQGFLRYAKTHFGVSVAEATVEEVELTASAGMEVDAEVVREEREPHAPDEAPLTFHRKGR